MLDTLAHLHDLHVRIKDATATFATSHSSMVCRAVSSSIIHVHLGNFMDKVLHVESSILKKDAGYVGAYEIVPLSTLVAEFAPWTRRLEWLWSVVEHLERGPKQAQGKRPCSGASILDFLSRETQTGFSDIEEMAVALLTVAQRAWMRAASLWVLYGKLPASGAQDFCVKPNPEPSSAMDTFMLDHSIVPKFVNPDAAYALLSTGSALSQLRSQASTTGLSSKMGNDPSMSLLPGHLRLLESLRYPLSPSLLENTLLSINQSISENALSQVLPRPLVLQLLQIILRFLLLDHGEFSVSLIAHADERVANRQQTQTVTRPIRKIGRLDDLAIKEAELNSILSKTMAEVAALQADDDADDDILNLAKKLLVLKSVDKPNDPRMVSTLLPAPTLLSITIAPSSPLHIFLSSDDVNTYAILNAYLISIHRAGLHLSALWKLSSYRRCYPTPLGPPRSASQAGRERLASRRSRDGWRTTRTRRYWTCASKALFMINELEAYLQGEVIQSSWTHFHTWLNGEERLGLSSAKSSRPNTASSTDPLNTTQQPQNVLVPPSDPRAMAEAHRRYLQTLTAALFVTDNDFMELLKTLLTQLDHFVALFPRLQAIWEGLDLQDDEGVEDAFSNYHQDQKEVLAEMDRTTDAIEASLIGLVSRIREFEKDKRPGAGIHSTMGSLQELGLNSSKFIPWHARTVDRLVMKLDSLAGKHEEERPESEPGMVHTEGYDDE